MSKSVYRIGLVGCAGTGKTALAEPLSASLKVPLLKSRAITDEILKRDGYDYSSGIQIERFLASSVRQLEILKKTIDQQEVIPFVTDRTVIDLAAYALCELHLTDVSALKKIVDACCKNAASYSHLFLCPWKDVPIQNNGKRTLNPWYQYQIHALERGIMDDWGCKYHVIQSESTKDRLAEVLGVLKKM